MAKVSRSKIDPALETAINKMLKSVQIGKSDPEGKKYTLTDVCKVVDRKLKLEAIKAKLDDGDMGTGFGDDDSDDTTGDD